MRLHTTKRFIIAFLLSATAVPVITSLTTTPVPNGLSKLKLCRDEKNCQHNAPDCELEDNDDKDLIKCICTPGFTGKHCGQNIIPQYYTTSSSYDMSTVQYDQIQNNTAFTRAAIEDQISQAYVGLPLSVEHIADIQENNIIALEQIKVTSNDNVNTMALDYGNLTFYVFNLTKGLNDDNGYLTTNKSKGIILKSEDSLVRVYKQYLKNEKETGMEILNKELISVAMMKKKGKNLPKIFETEFGNFRLPFWETFQDQYTNKYVSIIIISYSTTPYFFAIDANYVNTGIVKTLTLDEDMMEIKLPDPEDPVTINAESKTFSVSNKWKDMELLTSPEGAYMIVITFNYSVIAAAIDIKFTTRKECTTWGKFGNEKPSEEDHDILVITKGVSRIVKHRADRLSPVFSNQILQMSITYKGDEAETTPLVLISRCEDALSAGARRRRRSTNGGTRAGNAYQYRVAEVDLRHFNYDTAMWEASDAIKLKSGQGKDVAFESNFFGTFSASVLFIPPDTIDFHSIFLNFLGKLEENPYGLSLVLTLWLIFILIAIPLRRIDKGDAELWHYAPLIDNDPFARHTYYIAVSTAMRSARKFTSRVYFNIKGNKSQTGPRLLSDGYRENFIRGTTSYFCLTSSKELGKLKSMKIWHDNKGECTRWLLSKVVVGDFKNNKRYVFSCGEWLSMDSVDGKTYRKLHALDEKIVDNDLLFSDLSKRHLFDDHLWFSLSKRPHFSRFTRVQRMWSVAALLFLGMITSAMFYNTPDQIGRSISLGPFKFNYKQFYVGFMSAAFAIFPSIFIMSIFKNRRFKDEIKHIDKDTQNKQRCSCCTGGLPWWSIFLGYALIVGCIASSSFFIFMYSLDWGSTLTLEWMFAVFLGTVQSIFLMEPLKAVCLAVVVACCCAKIAQNQMAEIRFPDKEEMIDANQCVEKGAAHDKAPYIEWPDEGTETEAEKQYKRRLQLNQKLNSKLRSWILQFLYIAIILIICNHGDFEKVYRQNQHLENMIMKSYVVNTSEHIYDWIQQVYSTSVFSKWHYNGELKMSYTQRFVDDLYHFRMGLSRVRQVRVQGKCSIPVCMQSVVDICSLEYSTESEERRYFCRDWQEFNSTCFDENEEPDYAFLYNTADATQAFSYTGSYGTYGGGGYFLDIGPKYSLAVEYVEQLRNYKWIDKSTRAVFVECMLYNANSRLFSHVKVVFELPHFGGLVHTTVDISSTNLYPYKESWDYVILGLQVLFMAILLARLIILFVEIVRTKCGYLLGFFGIVRVLEIGFGISAIVFYIIRIDQTIAAIENIFNDIGLFVPFEKVIVIDKLYNYCIGAMCFISMIDLLKPLSFNFYLHLMKTAIISSRGKLFGFMFILGCVIMGFASILYLLYGHIEVEFRDIPSALLSLFRVMIGMVSFKQEMHIEEIGVILLFGLYCLLVTVIIMNIFISSLNMSFSDATEKVKISEKHRFDSEMNDYFWWKISNICGSKDDVEDQVLLNTPSPDPPCFENLESSPPPRGGVQVSKLQMQLIQQYRDDLLTQTQVLRTCLMLNNKIYDNRHLRCISRRLNDEIQFMFINREHMFMMMLHFHCATETAVIPAYMISAQDAIKSHVYPHIISAQPYTAMFVVKTEMLPKDTGPVEVKIVDRSSNPNLKNVFMMSSSDGGRTWEITAAVGPSKKSPCICAGLDTCPTHFLAVVSDSLFILPPQIQNRAEYHMLSPSGGIYSSEVDKRISISFEPDSVDCNTKLRLAVEPCFPSAMLHILCLIDIKNNLVRITLPQTSHVQPLKSGVPRDFIALYKEGFLDTWRKVPTSVRRKNNSFFQLEIKNIKRGVQTAIFVKASDFRDPSLYTEDKDLSALISEVCSDERAAMCWCSIGEKLGVSGDVIENLKTNTFMCCEEKCSIVFENWCSNTQSPFVTKLEECLKDLKIIIPQLENQYE